VSAASVSLLVAVVGLLGVALGWGLNLWSEQRREERRWAREDRLRFHDKKLAACEEFYISAVEVAVRVGNNLAPGSDLMRALARSEGSIGFLASPKLEKAAASVQAGIRMGVENKVQNRTAFNKGVNGLLGEFRRAIREELGVALEGEMTPLSMEGEPKA